MSILSVTFGENFILKCFYIPGGRLLFFHHFQQVRTFLENNKTKDNKFISLQPNKTKCKSEHEQSINSSLTVLKNWATVSQVCISHSISISIRNRIDAPLTSPWASTKNFCRGGWALINFGGFQGGRLFEGGRLLIFWAFRVGTYSKVGAYSNKYSMCVCFFPQLMVLEGMNTSSCGHHPGYYNCMTTHTIWCTWV